MWCAPGKDAKVPAATIMEQVKVMVCKGNELKSYSIKEERVVMNAMERYKIVQ